MLKNSKIFLILAASSALCVGLNLATFSQLQNKNFSLQAKNISLNPVNQGVCDVNPNLPSCPK